MGAQYSPHTQLLWSSAYASCACPHASNPPSTVLACTDRPVAQEHNGMVHVRAQSELDLFFGQGYITAQLRLWQMEYQRKLAAGRLAELIGGCLLYTSDAADE